MSLDLDLLPFWRNDDFSLEVLRVYGPRDFEKKILALPAFPVAPTFLAYPGGNEEEGEAGSINRLTKDAYGEPLLFTTAKQLKKLTNNRFIKGNQQNRAVWAFINALDDDARIALYWH